MCQFFSLVSDGNGKPYYFDWSIRKQILDGKIKLESADSHTSIADYYGFKGKKEDELNKYEYNPITKVFIVDQINTTDDQFFIKKFCEELNFKGIIPQLNIHPIVHPFKDFKVVKATEKDLELLKKWDSVWASVLASVWDSVRDSIWDSVRDSVRDSICDSVWVSVWDSVRDSIWDSVWDSVLASVWDSVLASVWAYMGTYFDIKYKVDISPSNDLWNKGIVPSFDGTLWRLHGHNGKIIWEGKIEDIK